MRASVSISRRPTLACGLSLAAGAIILFGGFTLGSFRPTSALSPLGVLSGALVLVAGMSLMVTPRRHTAAGLLIVVASAASLLAYGWLVLVGVGVSLGIAAGILAIQWEPSGLDAPVTVPE